MAIEFVGKGTAYYAGTLSAGTRDLALPEGTQAGDVLVLLLVEASYGGYTTPVARTQGEWPSSSSQQFNNNTPVRWIRAYYKRVSLDDMAVGNIQLSCTLSTSYYGVDAYLATYRGVDAEKLLASAVQITTVPYSYYSGIVYQSAGPLAVNEDNALVMAAFVGVVSSNPYTALPEGMTVRHNAAQGISNTALLVADAVQAKAGNTPAYLANQGITLYSYQGAQVIIAFTPTKGGVRYLGAGTQGFTSGAQSATGVRVPNLVAGDLLLAALVSDFTTAQIVPPDGWELVRDTSLSPTSTRRTALYRHIVEAGEPSSYQWSLSGPAPQSGSVSLIAYTGTHQTEPVRVSGALRVNDPVALLEGPTLDVDIPSAKIVSVFALTTSAVNPTTLLPTGSVWRLGSVFAESLLAAPRTAQHSVQTYQATTAGIITVALRAAADALQAIIGIEADMSLYLGGPLALAANINAEAEFTAELEGGTEPTEGGAIDQSIYAWMEGTQHLLSANISIESEFTCEEPEVVDTLPLKARISIESEFGAEWMHVDGEQELEATIRAFVASPEAAVSPPAFWVAEILAFSGVHPTDPIGAEAGWYAGDSDRKTTDYAAPDLNVPFDDATVLAFYSLSAECGEEEDYEFLFRGPLDMTERDAAFYVEGPRKDEDDKEYYRYHGIHVSELTLPEARALENRMAQSKDYDQEDPQQQQEGSEEEDSGNQQETGTPNACHVSAQIIALRPSKTFRAALHQTTSSNPRLGAPVRIGGFQAVQTTQVQARLPGEPVHFAAALPTQATGLTAPLGAPVQFACALGQATRLNPIFGVDVPLAAALAQTTQCNVQDPVRVHALSGAALRQTTQLPPPNLRVLAGEYVTITITWKRKGIKQ